MANSSCLLSDLSFVTELCRSSNLAFSCLHFQVVSDFRKRLSCLFSPPQSSDYFFSFKDSSLLVFTEFRERENLKRYVLKSLTPSSVLVLLSLGQKSAQLSLDSYLFFQDSYADNNT